MKIKFPRIDLDGVKGVLIDLDDTLYNYKACHEIAIKICHEKFSKDVNHDISLEKFNKSYRNHRIKVTKRLYPFGTCRSRLFAFQRMFEEMNLKNAWILALEYKNLYWNTIIHNIKLEIDAENFLKNCKKHGLLVCIVSDMLCETQILKLKKLGIENYIDYLVTSEEVGFEKPNKQIFDFALKKIGLNTNEIIMIGDNQTKDIEGAEMLGIKSYKVELSEKN